MRACILSRVVRDWESDGHDDDDRMRVSGSAEVWFPRFEGNVRKLQGCSFQSLLPGAGSGHVREQGRRDHNTRDSIFTAAHVQEITRGHDVRTLAPRHMATTTLYHDTEKSAPAIREYRRLEMYEHGTWAHDGAALLRICRCALFAFMQLK